MKDREKIKIISTGRYCVIYKDGVIINYAKGKNAVKAMLAKYKERYNLQD